jgi:hypothetical protein
VRQDPVLADVGVLEPARAGPPTALMSWAAMKPASLTSAGYTGLREMTHPSGRFHRCTGLCPRAISPASTRSRSVRSTYARRGKTGIYVQEVTRQQAGCLSSQELPPRRRRPPGAGPSIRYGHVVCQHHGQDRGRVQGAAGSQQPGRVVIRVMLAVLSSAACGRSSRRRGPVAWSGLVLVSGLAGPVPCWCQMAAIASCWLSREPTACSVSFTARRGRRSGRRRGCRLSWRRTAARSGPPRRGPCPARPAAPGHSLRQ